MAQTSPTVGPGWVYDASSGIRLGPCSYEMSALYKASYDPNPMPTTYAGMPQKVIVRQRPSDWSDFP